MKTLLLSIILFTGVPFIPEVDNSVTVEVTDYCNGWKEGFCDGYKDVKGQFAICPPPPVCPVPKIECNRGYKCGYNRGFKYGRKKASGI